VSGARSRYEHNPPSERENNWFALSACPADVYAGGDAGVFLHARVRAKKCRKSEKKTPVPNV
jgi:hypothetical protein